MPSVALRRYLPSPLLRTSAGIHLAAGTATLLAPQAWTWALGAVAVNQALIVAGGLLPRSQLLGPNLTRLPPSARARGEVALTFDDGPDPELTPWVLDRLDAAGMRASFFCVGERARRHAALVREIGRRGHTVENHTQGHPHAFATYGPRRMALEIERAQATLSDITGRCPRYFRAVAGLRNPFLQPILERLGLRLASWTRRPYDTRVTDPAVVLRRLTCQLSAGDILLLHDGRSARDARGRTVLSQMLQPLLDALRARNLRSVHLQAALEPSA